MTSKSSSINSDFSNPNDSIHENASLENASINDEKHGSSECRMKPVPLSGSSVPHSCSSIVSSSKPPLPESNEAHYSTFDPATPMYQHDFQPKTFLRPTFCDWCKKIILGLYKQGLKCNGKLQIIIVIIVLSHIYIEI
jgi:hypothetical protein